MTFVLISRHTNGADVPEHERPPGGWSAPTRPIRAEAP
jgi:hypothetical protein